MKSLMLLVLASGCGGFSAPSPADDDKAFAIVWEQTLHMAKEGRPALQWLPPESCDHQGQRLPAGVLSACAEFYVVDNDDTKPASISVVWNGSFSDSQFSAGLAVLRNRYLLGSYATVDNSAAVNAANDALIAAGL